MKKLFTAALLLFSICAAKAQEIYDVFDVGPYSVLYKGQGDVDYKMKQGVDLYEFFGLKKDTVIQVAANKPEQLKHGIQLDLFAETCMFRSPRYSMSFGIETAWKQNITKNLYANGGVSFGYAAVRTIKDRKEDIIEIGIPLSVEWASISKRKASLYGSVGITPSYYTNALSKIFYGDEGEDVNEYNGFYVAPGIDLGGYIPAGNQLFKIGVTCRYKINCTPKSYDIYDCLVGALFAGAKLCIIL